MGYSYFSFYSYLAFLLVCMLATEISEAQIGLNVFPTEETSYKNSFTGITESLLTPTKTINFMRLLKLPYPCMLQVITFRQ